MAAESWAEFKCDNCQKVERTHSGAKKPKWWSIAELRLNDYQSHPVHLCPECTTGIQKAVGWPLSTKYPVPTMGEFGRWVKKLFGGESE